MTKHTHRKRLGQAPAIVIALVALFAAISGTAAALPGTQTVNSGDIKNESVKSIDLKDGKAVASSDVIDETLTGLDVADDTLTTQDVKDQTLTGTDVEDNSLTGADVAESTLGQVPSATTLNGKGPGAFVSSAVYKRESPIGPGNTIGDGTQVISQACDAGDLMLSGGPANVNANTDLLESFPAPGTTNAWQARVNKNGAVDNWSVVVLCANQ